MKSRLHTYDNTETLVSEVTQRIIHKANSCIAERGAFHLVLAGGSTPEIIYEALSEQETDWQSWHLYFGDERFLRRGDINRNETMVSMAWLDHVTIPCHQVLVMATGESLQAAADHYTDVIANAPEFDLVLLGLGEDGHTASLFPGNDLGDTPDSPDILSITDAPKPPAERLSISANRLSQANEVFFVVTGEGKKEPMTRWLNNDPIPAAAIQPSNGIDIFLDQAATPAT